MRQLLLTFMLAVSFACSAQNRIIGGTPATIQERPYQVAIYCDGMYSGGGVLIENRWVLTAAHVVSGSQPSSLIVKYGNAELSQCLSATVQSVYVHGQYEMSLDESNYGQTINDIALLRLTQPIVSSSEHRPISLSTATSFTSGTKAIVSGWGQTYNSFISNTLNKAEVTISSCTNGVITCETSNSSSYYGDSGGPLTRNGVLIGIVKGREHHPTDLIPLYTNIGYYYNWIYETILSTAIISYPSFLVLGSTATLSCVCDIPISSCNVSPHLNIVSMTSNSIVVRGVTSGYAQVTITTRGLSRSVNFNVGVPIISDVYYNNGYLFVNLYGGANTNHTEWEIGGNVFSAYDPFIWCPDQYGTINIKVRAEVDGVWSVWYETQITLDNSSHYYNISINNGVLSFVPADDYVECYTLSDEQETLMYQIINANTNQLVDSGESSPYGGTISIGSLSHGFYIFTLRNNNMKQTFKFSK